MAPASCIATLDGPGVLPSAKGGPFFVAEARKQNMKNLSE